MKTWFSISRCRLLYEVKQGLVLRPHDTNLSFFYFWTLSRFPKSRTTPTKDYSMCPARGASSQDAPPLISFYWSSAVADLQITRGLASNKIWLCLKSFCGRWWKGATHWSLSMFTQDLCADGNLDLPSKAQNRRKQSKSGVSNIWGL